MVLHLYEGYDWRRTQQVLEEQQKAIRKRLVKLKQMLSNGQTLEFDPFDGTSALLFNSVHVGLKRDFDDLDEGDLLAAINQQLGNDEDASLEASWETIRPTPPGTEQSHLPSSPLRSLSRRRDSSIEIILSGLEATCHQFAPGAELASRILVTARELEILDHIRSSTWQRFLTSMRTDSQGNIRESDSNMVRVELKTLKPSSKSDLEEVRLRAKILPLRLHVDQDALDFLKAFFAFQSPDEVGRSKQQEPSEGAPELFFRESISNIILVSLSSCSEQVEIFPVQIKLDYKPKRVDYNALREGKTIELMNFFHFEGSEMTLRHIMLSG